MRRKTWPRFTQAGQRPSFSGRRLPQVVQRINSKASLMLSGSPFASCSMPRASSEKRGAAWAVKAATAMVPWSFVRTSSFAPPTRASVRADLMFVSGMWRRGEPPRGPTETPVASTRTISSPKARFSVRRRSATSSRSMVGCIGFGDGPRDVRGR